MAKRGGGIGLVMLVVVMAAVLLLVARAWEGTGATAIDVTQPAASVPSRGQHEAAEALQTLPGLNDVRRGTDAHAQQVQDILEGID